MRQCERLAESKESYDVLIQSLENQVSSALTPVQYFINETIADVDTKNDCEI
jgi:hypothetical protein